MIAGKKARTPSPTLSVHEAREAKRKEAIKRGAKKRSDNMRRRSFAEVKTNLANVGTQLNTLARNEGRKDFRVIARIVYRLQRWGMTIAPQTRGSLSSLIREFDYFVYSAMSGWANDEEGDRTEIKEPTMTVRVTHKGLAALQVALAERVAAGLAPPPPAPWTRSLVNDALANPLPEQ